MLAFDLLKMLDQSITPDKCKVHLATWNGEEDPLDVYLAGNFAEWQRWQTRKNFERPFVIALINLPAPNQWLFGGAYTANGARQRDGLFYYDMDEVISCNELNGRLIVAFERPGRQSYLNGDRWSEHIAVPEIRALRLSIGEFPGYRSIDLTKVELDIVVGQAIASWKSALSSVAGVYLISDTRSGKLYVGSASGEGGIWQRWIEYSATGHGGNVELKSLLKADGMDRSSHFRFSILEIADLHESRDDILRRETHWKNVLLSRIHGLNAN
jgi:hypothetical protein